MIRVRLRPLLALVGLLAVILIARLFQVQVHEHGVWAREAALLVLHGREEPYVRGRILDAAGRVLARDEQGRRVDLVYRDFRRSHPLGQVAHARSLLEGRPVSLSAARAQLVEWGAELVALTPRALAAFARGEVGEKSKRGLDRRLHARRASDLYFYVQRLLGLDGSDQRATRKAVLDLAGVEGEERSFLALAASVRRGDTAEALQAERDEFAARLAHSLERLAVLARWLRPDTVDPLGVLVDDIERERRLVEDASAAKLFAEAGGFAPGRIEADTLLECFDHGWITALLGWDAARLGEWAEVVRTGWQTQWRDEVCLPQIFANLAFDEGVEPGPADFLARLAVVYQPEGELERALAQGPRPWREVDELAIFTQLDDLFAAEVPAAAHALGRAALPIQLAELRADPDDRRLLPPGAGTGSFVARLAEACSTGRLELATLLELARDLNSIWELRFQETLRQVLDETRRAAGRDQLGPEGGLRLSAAGRDRAAERAEFYLMDFGSRARALSAGELSYDVVYLLTRHERDFPGFRVRTLETRVRVELAGDDLCPAERLIGRVQEPTLDDLLRQRRDAARLRELKQQPWHAEDQKEELQRLIGAVRLPTEVAGVEGLEAFFDRELTGQNGFTMTRGLADLFGAGGDELPVREPTDGEDVQLTLDAGLQAAAQRCLRQPSSQHEDLEWRQNPVGAIVLLSREGDVLAAASEPDEQSFVGPEAEGQRKLRIERTLKKPTFQPPGSSFKVFVAAWALEHGLDPTRTVVCAPLASGGAGYKTLHCWNTGGHGELDLRAALVQSCNAYFAWLGETLDTAAFAALCAQFGFGQPTGVRNRLPWDEGAPQRTGLSEDRAGLSLPKNGAELSASLRSMAANGLGRIEATPMQVARGILALATGEKRELRLVQRVGERELPHGPSEPLALGSRALEFVREAMRGVAADAHGTAHNALSPSQLGFAVAVKTGSADLENRKDREGKIHVRKHAWVAGWAPARAPELVFVIFEHDTSATSSHGAVFLAREFLRQPEVLLYLAQHGVDVSGVPAR